METWIQITSGVGPIECSRAVYRTVGLLESAIMAAGGIVRRLHTEPDIEKETFKSVVLSASGDLEAVAREWEGSIQWVCQSPFRPNHKRKNWFIGVTFLSAPETNRFDPADLKIETMRGSGPGGQHVNTTDSAVRVTHLPTGLVAMAAEERSQTMNKKLAMARIEKKLEDLNADATQSSNQARWEANQALERGNPVKVFKGPNFTEA